jgi:Ca-activated chloride channel family protein
MFGALLRQSKFAKENNWNILQQIATRSADQQNFSQKEFLTLIPQARALYGKKRKKTD